MHLNSTRLLVVAALAAWIALGLAAAWGYAVLFLSQDPEAPTETFFAQMDPGAKRKILQAYERFIAFPPERQLKLRELHQYVEGSGRAEELRRLMDQYSRFLASLPPYERVELQQLTPDRRAARTKELYAERQRHRSRIEAFWIKLRADWHRRLFPPELTPEDVDAVGRWAEEFGTKHTAVLLHHVPADRRSRIEEELSRTREPGRRREILAWLWLRWQVSFPGKLPPAEPEARQQLLELLSPNTRLRLQALPSGEQDRIFFRAIRYWVASQLSGRTWEGPPPVISEEELAVFLQQTLSPERREDLFRSEPGERMSRLWWEFLRSRWVEAPEGQPSGVGAWPGIPPGPGPFRPGGPPGFGLPPGVGIGPPAPGGTSPPGGPRRRPPSGMPSPPGREPGRPGEAEDHFRDWTRPRGEPERSRDTGNLGREGNG
jgi:hypothetical protein